MPISKINSDGTVNVYNSKTGEIKNNIPAEGLGAISPNLVGEYQTLKSSADALGEGKLSPSDLPQDTRVAAVSSSDYTAKTAKQKEKALATEDSLQKSQAILDIIDKNRKGQITGKDFETTLNSLASQYVASKAFGEGGKNLTATELAVLSGQIPIIEKRTGNPVEKFVAWAQGREVPQQGKLVDSPEEVERKMKIAQATLKGEQITPELFTAKSKSKGIPERLISGAGQDLQDIGQGVVSLGQAAVTGQLGTRPNPIPGLSFVTPEAVQFGIEASKGLVDEVKKAAPIRMDNGQAIFDPGKTLNYAIDNPVDTALAVLPMTKGLKGATSASKVAKGAEAATAAKTGLTLPSINPSNLAKKAATTVVDVTTGGGSQKALAREARGAVPQNQVLLEEGILKRPSESGKTKATVVSMDRIGEDIAKAYKNSTEKIDGKTLQGVLDNGLRDLGWADEDINSIKNYLTRNGQIDLTPEGITTTITPDQLWKSVRKIEKNPPKSVGSAETQAALRDLNSNATRLLRTYLGDLVKETKPLNERYSTLKDYFDYKLPNNPKGVNLQPNQGIASKALGGAGSALNVATNYAVSNPLYDLLKGKLPPIESTAMVDEAIQAPPATRIVSPTLNSTVPNEVIETIIKGKGEPQSTRLKRDMRYKAGNWESRKEKEKFVERSSKKRYK